MIINQVDQWRSIVSILASRNSPIAIDTETNITEKFNERYCMGISIAQEDDYYYIPVGHTNKFGLDTIENISYVPDDIFDPIVNSTIIFHNAKFDLHVLASLGIKKRFWNMYDTMLMSHYIDENGDKRKDFGRPHSLDVLSARYSTVVKNTAIAKALRNDWDNAWVTPMAIYAQEDAQATLQVFEALDKQFDDYRVTWNEVDKYFLYVLFDIEARGIILDKEKCAEHQLACLKRMKEIRTELGFDPAKTSQLHSKLFDSPPFGYGLKPTSRTPKTGKPQVNTAFLTATNHPVCGLLLEYRQLAKNSSSYFGSYLNIVGDGDRLHPTFKMHGTVTGRLSCENPNLQQIPRKSEVKRMFLPNPGKELWEIDYRNLEMRMAAVYCQQPALLQAFQEERDIHQEVADRLGITRQVAKIVNFLLIYGGGAEALAFQAGITLRAAKQVYDDYKKFYPEIFSMMDMCTNVALTKGEVRLFSGRKRHFKWQSECRKAFNSIIQGGSFELVKRSMLKLDKAGFDVYNQVHDSVWIMADHENEVIEAEKVMSEWTLEDFGLLFSVDRKQLR